MDSVSVRNAQGESTTISVIRFFRLNGAEYLLFSLNEIDDGGYIKLYVCKVVGEQAVSITDDIEWNLIKDTIKDIIKMNKDNLPLPIVDINVGKLNNIQIVEEKVFKLSETFINLLGANKKVEETTISPETSEEVIEDVSIQDSAPVQPQLEQEIVPESQPVEFTDYTAPVTEYQTSVGPTDLSVQDQSVNQNVEDDIPDEAKYSSDYKTLYETELIKNKELMEQNQKFKNIIDNLKKTIEEAL